VSLLIGDDYPEAVGPHDRENRAPAEGQRDRPASKGKRHDWSRWRGHRSRSMLIQDAPDPDDDRSEDDDGAEDDYDGGSPYRGNGVLLDTGPGAHSYPPEGYPPAGYPQNGYPPGPYPGDRITGDRFPGSGYADSRDYWDGEPGFRDPGYPDPGYGDSVYSGADEQDPDSAGFDDPGPRYPDAYFPDSGHPDSGHPGSGYPGSGRFDPGRFDPGYADPGRPGRGDPDSGYPGGRDGESWYGPEGHGFRVPPAPAGDSWDDGWSEPDPEDEPAGAPRIPRLETLSLRRVVRDRDAGGSRTFTSRAQRLGGVLLAGASVVGVVLYVPSILAANSRSFTGVVSSSGIASLNFGRSGRVASVRVHLGQVVRQGELLATETGAARTAAVRADRAAITADKANLAALQADGSAAASITAAQAQLARDRARRAADQTKLVATEIMAPSTGTVVAIFGQPGETVSPAGLRGSAAHAQASPAERRRFSLLPGGPMASLRAGGMALPVIALRTDGGWQVRLLIPQTDTSAVKVGGNVTISIPAAQLSGVKGTITELSPTPVTSSGGTAYEAVVRVPGRTRITPLSGMTADIQLGSLPLQGQMARAAARRVPASRSVTHGSPTHRSFAQRSPHGSPTHGAGTRHSG
jgi:multidrug efflux pump subunit AcrA (membrane-fusion protein)